MVDGTPSGTPLTNCSLLAIAYKGGELLAHFNVQWSMPPPWVEPERWQDLAWVMAMMENGNYPMEVGPMLSAWDKLGVRSEELGVRS